MSTAAPLLAPAPAGVDRKDGTLPVFSAGAAFLASFLTPFTVAFVGAMPVGEFVLAAAAGWAVLCVAMNQAWPSPLLRDRYLGFLLGAQAVALAAYVFSDLYRGSSPVDMARGWSRMVFLAVDIVALAYLFGRSPGNFFAFVAGICAGEAASTILVGPMFGDLWKFGWATPVTYLGFLVAPLIGRRWPAFLAAAGLGVLNFALDFRSLGGICLIAAALGLLQLAPRRSRLWLAPAALLAGGLAALSLYQRMDGQGQRATRSDVEREAMVQAAYEAFIRSPVVGNGSWFSNTHVYDDFLEIRHQNAREAHVGGFADVNTDPGDMALHSQILVTLAEGGIFGGAFFLCYGAGLLRALAREVLAAAPSRHTLLRLLLLLTALWNLGFSPFSGAHRVAIAMAVGLLLLMRREEAAAA